MFNITMPLIFGKTENTTLKKINVWKWKIDLESIISKLKIDYDVGIFPRGKSRLRGFKIESQLIVGSVFPLALTCSIYYMTLMFGIISYC